MDGDPQINLKIVIIGESGVGKSSLLLRFADDQFDAQQELTIGVDYKSKDMWVDDIPVRLNIWDTAGQERFRTLAPIYYRDAHGVILVYDITSRKTFVELERWLNEFEMCSTTTNVIKMVVGNKIDKNKREVTTAEGIQFARLNSALFIESSAKTSDNVNCAFEELAHKIVQTPGLCEATGLKKDTVNLSGGSHYTGDRTCFGSLCS